jgi:hypothetical protein
MMVVTLAGTDQKSGWLEGRLDSNTRRCPRQSSCASLSISEMKGLSAAINAANSEGV